MRLGLHYHLPVEESGDSLMTQGPFAIFANELARRVDRLVLFAPPARGGHYPCDTRLDPGIRWVRVPPRYPHYVRYLIAGRWVRRHSEELAALDLMLVRVPTPMAEAFLASRLPSRRAAYIVGGRPGTRSRSLRGRLVARYAEAVHTRLKEVLREGPSAAISASLLQEYSLEAEHCRVIPSASLSASEIPASLPNRSARPLRILYVGRFSKEKGLDVLGKALLQLRNRGVDLEARLVGPWEDPSLVRYLGQLLPEGATVLPAIPRGEALFKHYRWANLFVLPSYNEGLGRAALEAMAFGLPVVASRVGGLPEIVRDRDTGFLFESGDPSECAEKILQATEEDVYPRLQQGAFEEGRRHTIEESVQQLVVFLNRVVADVNQV